MCLCSSSLHLLLISKFIPLWLENIAGMISILLTYRVLYDLFYAQCYRASHVHLGICVFCCWVACSVVVSQVQFIYTIVKSSISLLIFCQFYSLLKVRYWSLQLLLFNCLFHPSGLSVFLHKFWTLLLGAFMFIIIRLPDRLTLLSL